MKYEAILFDLDGTIADTVGGIKKSIHFALSQFGISEKNEDILLSFIGAPLLISFQDTYSLSEADALRALAFYRESYDKMVVSETSIYPGMPSLLNVLKGAGKRLIVATLKPTVYAERILAHFKLRDNFDHVFGPALGETEITKTEIIERALTEVPAAAAGRVIMVGDRAHDIDGARENGIDSAAVAYGYGSMEELQQADPTYLAKNVEELRGLLGS